MIPTAFSIQAQADNVIPRRRYEPVAFRPPGCPPGCWTPRTRRSRARPGVPVDDSEVAPRYRSGVSSLRLRNAVLGRGAGRPSMIGRLGAVMARLRVTRCASLVGMTDDRQKRLDPEGALFIPGQRVYKVTPRAAAIIRKLGGFVDPRDVAGVDDGMLDPSDGAYFRAAGVTVLDSEIASRPSAPRRLKHDKQ